MYLPELIYNTNDLKEKIVRNEAFNLPQLFLNNEQRKITGDFPVI
jgi:hypothetical protein